ncbi:hypothetical protein C0991_001287 [Blastosporella zonata]|nr:hypothetical protein C0991_001287 [Blastosporella zonata]
MIQHRCLQIPSSLSKLNLDLSSLWLIRKPSKQSPASSPTVEPEKPIVNAQVEQLPTNEPPRARTPVFTRPPPGFVFKPLALPSPTFTFGETPYRLPCVAEVQAARKRERMRVWEEAAQKPIQLPELMPLKLQLALPDFDWNDQPSDLSSPLEDVAFRAGRADTRLSPNFFSPKNFECSRSPFTDEFDTDPFPRRCFGFDEDGLEDEAYFGDVEDGKCNFFRY